MEAKDTTPDSAETVQAFIDGKTKPLGSLGTIEKVAAQLATISGTLQPEIDTCELISVSYTHLTLPTKRIV